LRVVEGGAGAKFSGELRMAIEFLSATVGCGLGSSYAKDGKEEGSRSGLASFWMGPSFVEVLRSDLISAVKSLPIVGGCHSRRRALPVELFALDLLSVMRFVDDNSRLAVDCSTLESSTVDLLDKDQPHRPLGKKPLRRSNLKFEISNLCTWSKLVIVFNKVLGRAARKFLGRIRRFGLGRKRNGLRLGRFLPKSKVSRLSRLLPEMLLEISSGVFLCLSSPGGGSFSCLKTGPASSPVKSASLPIFPPLLAPELLALATLVAPPAPAGLLVSLEFSSSSCGAGPSVFVPRLLSGASVLGEKIRSSPPLLHIHHFQHYYRRARELRVGHSVKWNDGLLSDSLEASKLSMGLVLNKVTGAVPLAKKKTKPPVKQGLFMKGFLNLPPIVSVPPASSWEVNDIVVVGPSSPPKGCIIPPFVEGNGFSQSRNWPVGFDHNGEIVDWEEEDDYWDGLPLDWASDGAFGEEAMAIWDAMGEDFQRDKMFARQKSKGKRELLNLHSSINYGDAKDPFRRRKGKAHMV
jgi:hypothetical protein